MKPDWSRQIYVDFETAKKLHHEHGIGFDLCWLSWGGKKQSCIHGYGRRLVELYPAGNHRIHQDSLEIYDRI